VSGARTVLRLQGVTKSFPAVSGRVEVLRGVDLEIRTGEFVVLTGPSGSGKSTLLHLCALLDRPSSGELWLEDAATGPLDDDALAALRTTRIGMIFQRFHLLPHRSALDNVRFRFRYAGAPPNAGARARAALEEVGLGALADRRARLLSGGEMQRVAIARALALRPTLLVADEPTGNLDHAATEAVMACLRRGHAEGLTILLVTHNERLLPYATRHVVCREGRIVEEA
jgi:putative ABC transport system ATP-binding protein